MSASPIKNIISAIKDFSEYIIFPYGSISKYSGVVVMV